jgi:hypothetical protein
MSIIFGSGVSEQCSGQTSLNEIYRDKEKVVDLLDERIHFLSNPDEEINAKYPRPEDWNTWESKLNQALEKLRDSYQGEPMQFGAHTKKSLAELREMRRMHAR